MDERALVRDLGAWYARGHRDLPWRGTRDPYAVWLSEIMLQQTQVTTVLPYYARFLEAFPTVQALADAPDDRVMKAWEGLGYYARCRNLLAAARLVCREHAGEFPRTLEGTRALPGVGRSTAGAILSFCHGEAHPIVEANVKRVLARLYAIAGELEATATQKALWEIAERLVALAPDPGAHNQALMELGQSLCTRGSPRCDDCPLAPHCQARATGRTAELPRRRARRKVPHHDIAVGVIWKGPRVLIQRRPPEGLLGGLWEFPGGKKEAGEALEQTVAREVAEELGITVDVGDKLATVKHGYTHFRITLHAFTCRYAAGEPTPRAATDWRWVTRPELAEYAFPAANKRVLAALDPGADAGAERGA